MLAAGRSSRMGAANKLLTEVDGMPMVRRAVEAATASHARPVIVVTGNEQGKVQAALRGCKATFVHNPRFAEGMSTSLQAGLAALPANVDGALVCLGDMPLVTAAALDRLIAAFNPLEGRAICVPTWNGKRGNPVLWDRRFFAAMADLAGDVGAKHLIGEHADAGRRSRHVRRRRPHRHRHAGSAGGAQASRHQGGLGAAPHAVRLDLRLLRQAVRYPAARLGVRCARLLE